MTKIANRGTTLIGSPCPPGRWAECGGFDEYGLRGSSDLVEMFAAGGSFCFVIDLSITWWADELKNVVLYSASHEAGMFL